MLPRGLLKALSACRVDMWALEDVASHPGGIFPTLLKQEYPVTESPRLTNEFSSGNDAFLMH